MNHDPELCATCQLHLDLYGESFWDANKGEQLIRHLKGIEVRADA